MFLAAQSVEKANNIYLLVESRLCSKVGITFSKSSNIDFKKILFFE